MKPPKKFENFLKNLFIDNDELSLNDDYVSKIQQTSIFYDAPLSKEVIGSFVCLSELQFETLYENEISGKEDFIITVDKVSPAFLSFFESGFPLDKKSDYVHMIVHHSYTSYGGIWREYFIDINALRVSIYQSRGIYNMPTRYVERLNKYFKGMDEFLNPKKKRDKKAQICSRWDLLDI